MGPFVVGVAAGGHPGSDLLALLVALLAGFLLHQPASLAVKAVVGRRPRAELAPALVWCGIYALLALAATPFLVAAGHAVVLGLLAPGAGVFAWHLALVARRAERRQFGVQLLGSGVMALAAPAAYWVAGGTRYPEPWVLWSLCWVQSAAGIANVYLALDQRSWKAVGSVRTRLAAGRATLGLHLLGLALALAFTASGHAPRATFAAFLLPLFDAVDTVARPRLGARPSAAGIRQLVVIVLFVAGMFVVWR
jgi:hypothetical protein